MERTPEFAEAILKARSDSQQEAVADRICLSSSPFVLRASELVSFPHILLRSNFANLSHSHAFVHGSELVFTLPFSSKLHLKYLLQ
jgi:hypothetical protein